MRIFDDFRALSSDSVMNVRVFHMTVLIRVMM